MEKTNDWQASLDDLVDESQAAELLSITVKELRRLLEQGDLVTVRDGRTNGVFLRTDIERYRDLRMALEYREEASPLCRMANAILSTAIDANVSEIHIEPHSERTRIRFRQDDTLIDWEAMPKKETVSILATVPRHIHRPLTVRYKDMAGLTVLRREPQVGWISVVHNALHYTVRVAVLPAGHGDAICLHITSENLLSSDLTPLGITPELRAELDTIFANPSGGLFLVSGASGSGLTTTACSLTARLALDETRKVIALNEREYKLPGVVQVGPADSHPTPFSQRDAFTVALQQNPNVLHLGDLADSESIRDACEAALRGIWVLAVFPATDSDAVHARLDGCGIWPGILRGILSQHLMGTGTERTRVFSLWVPAKNALS